MILIRKGFDGLDISYPLTISEDVAEKLEIAKQESERIGSDGGVYDHNGLEMLVSSTGAKGGFRYLCRTSGTSPMGETWKFKQPTGNNDAWGISISCNALPLALYGLSGVRKQIEATLERLGLDYQPGTESIGRVDVCADVICPGLVLDRDHIVCHSRCGISEYDDGGIASHGRSSRVETLTIGKNPNLQVSIYDKRADTIAKKKTYWVDIWNDALARRRLPLVDLSSRDTSEVWRVEVRAFKQHLKKRWKVTTWADLRDILPKILDTAMKKVRLTVPTFDSNRHRWPNHPLWSLVSREFEDDFTDLASMVDQASILALLRAERDEMFQAQIRGCMLNRAALNGVDDDNLGSYLFGSNERLVREMLKRDEWTRAKLATARARYS